MSKPTIGYQIIPGATEHSWSWRIFRSDMPDSKDVPPAEPQREGHRAAPAQFWEDPEQKIWYDTNVKTSGGAWTRGRAEYKARRQVARALRAYEMLAR